MSNTGQRKGGRRRSRAKEHGPAEKPQKDRFSIKMQKKLVVLYVLVLLAFAGLSARLIWITREDGTKYQKQVLAQQRYDSTTIPYRRGDILDSQGTRLATSEKVYNLVIDAKVMLSTKGKYLEPTLQALGSNFDLNMAEIREYINTHPTSSWYVPLRQLTYDQISGFQEEKRNNANIQGVWFEEEYKRIYPYGSLAADVIGFTSADSQGNFGLEEYYNNALNGINGREYGYLNDDLALERTVKAAVDGYTLHTTIDINIQSIVEKYLKQFNDQYADSYHSGNGADHAACTIQELNTGRILAMAEYPNYDLNDVRNPKNLLGCKKVEQITNANGYFEIRTTNTIIDETVLAEMTQDELYLNLNNLWKNYCITGTYEPGSTAKPFTVAAALEEGLINDNSSFVCDGYLEIGGYKIHCHNKYDGTLTLEQAVAKSCNVAMMKIAQKLGEETFIDYQQLFNFGLRTNVDLAGEARTASLVYTADRMGPTDLATNSFGQNFNVTMIEMITGFSSLVNGGYYYEPHLVDKITNSNGATIENIEPRVLKQTVSESTSALIRKYCTAVVTEGTGVTARPAGYMIGGKTGTAETIDPVTHTRSEKDHVVSFIAFAPADDPQIAIYVVVDRPNVEKQGDPKFATQIVRNILTEVLPYLNIYMTEELSDAERKELEDLHIAITNQYTQTPEGDALDNTEGQGDGGNKGTDVGNQNKPWKNFPVDPATGYYVDPSTGEQYDPKTGMTIDGSESVVDPNIPVNPSIGSGLQ